MNRMNSLFLAKRLTVMSEVMVIKMQLKMPMKFGNWPCRKTSALLFALESIILKLETWRRTLCLKVIDVKGLRSYFSQMFPNICRTYLEAASTAASSSLNLVFFLTSLMKLTRPSLSSCPFRK